MEDWLHASRDARSAKALRSPHLAASIQHYLDGFAEDLDSFYAGINALAMLKIQIELAKALPESGPRVSTTGTAAVARSKDVRAPRGRIAATLQLALGTDRRGDAERGEARHLERDQPCRLVVPHGRQADTRVRQRLSKGARRGKPVRDRRGAAQYPGCSANSGCWPPNVEAALEEMQQAAPEKAEPLRRASSCSRATCWTRRTAEGARRVFPDT